MTPSEDVPTSIPPEVPTLLAHRTVDLGDRPGQEAGHIAMAPVVMIYEALQAARACGLARRGDAD